MQRALGDDTLVVFNLSQLRCDALLINNRMTDIRILQLENLSIHDAAFWSSQLKASRPLIDPVMLEWLWSNVAHPVLGDLSFGEPPIHGLPPRVIWIPSGPLCYLPIHAAGIHASRSTTVMGGVVSSYSSSLQSFVFGRGLKPAASPNSARKALLVGVGQAPSYPGLGSLPFVTEEIEQVEKICTSLGIKPDCLREPSREDVLGHLPECAIFHFAGHGLVDSNEPSQSGLLVNDGHLTVTHLLGIKLQQYPFLAFLSACLTGANDDEQLQDERLHLISACQLVGFHHVIGTLWQVSDRACVGVAQVLYTHLARNGTTNDSVCRGLHQAVLDLRDPWASQGSTSSRGVDIQPMAGRDEDSLAKEDWMIDDGISMGRNEDNNEMRSPHENREPRAATLRLQKRAANNWVRADWIPYVHYGP